MSLPWPPSPAVTGVRSGAFVFANSLKWNEIAPAELVPDSADLYMGADLLNRFFGSWMGDAQGKSPLEAARNVIVTYLTGPGLKVRRLLLSFVCLCLLRRLRRLLGGSGSGEEEGDRGSTV